MYCNVNFRTKKALKEAVAAGRRIGVHQWGPFGWEPDAKLLKEGKVTLEGPHYPESHRWYATAVIEDGVIVKVS